MSSSTPSTTRTPLPTRNIDTSSINQTPTISNFTPPSSSLNLPTNPLTGTAATRSKRNWGLYGTEDRIVLDLGSKNWKVGFSGEVKPRAVVHVRTFAPGVDELWELDLLGRGEEIECAERERLLGSRLLNGLRMVFHKILMIDPKQRKVIVVESPFLPLRIKELVARILFQNLQVPSVAFTSSHVLSLMAAGALTGLIVDCANLETCVLPIFVSRPLYSYVRTTPLAGRALMTRFKSLILAFGTYIPPPSTSTTSSASVTSRGTRVPREILTGALLEDLIARVLFVRDPLPPDDESTRSSNVMDLDVVPSSRPPPASYETSMSMETEGRSTTMNTTATTEVDTSETEFLDSLRKRYEPDSTASSLKYRLSSNSINPSQIAGAAAGGTGKGTLLVPGWIRENAAEILFEAGDIDDVSIQETILDVLLRLPKDLRKPLASSILVIGGTSMLPGFIPRLRKEIILCLERSTPSTTDPQPNPSLSASTASSRSISNRLRHPRLTYSSRFHPIRPLSPHIAILNDPFPPPPPAGTDPTNPASGRAPSFAPSLLPWIGGSLAGSLKTNGEDISNEVWKSANEAVVVHSLDQDPMGLGAAAGTAGTEKKSGFVMPDWSTGVKLK